MKFKSFLILFSFILFFCLFNFTEIYAQNNEDSSWFKITDEKFEAYADFSIGVELGIKFNHDDTIGVGWGINSSSFNDNTSLFIEFFIGLIDTDQESGTGGVYLWTKYTLEEGRAGVRDSGFPVTLYFKDLLGKGNHIIFYAASQYHNLDDKSLVPGVVYLMFLFGITDTFKVRTYLVDYQNQGIAEGGLGSNGITFEPQEAPDSWQYSVDENGDLYLTNPNDTGRTLLSFIGETITEDILFDFTITAGIMRSVYNTMDEKIMGYQQPPDSPVSQSSLVENNIWYGNFSGVPLDERPGYKGDFHLALSISLGLDLQSIKTGEALNTSTDNKDKSIYSDLKFELNNHFRFTGFVELGFISKQLFKDKENKDFTISFVTTFSFVKRSRKEIQGETLLLILPELPFKVQRFEFKFDLSYTYITHNGEGIKVIPNAYVVLDITEFVNAPRFDYIDNPLPAWSLRMGLDFGVGYNSLLTIPIYVRLTNIPLQTYILWDDNPDNYRLTYGAGAASEHGPEIPQGPDEDFRIYIGSGFEISF